MARHRALLGALGLLYVLAAPGAIAALPLSSHESSPPSCSASYKGGRCPNGSQGTARGKHPHALFFKAVDGHCPDTALKPSATDVAAVRAATLCLVNRERARHGERPLHWNGRLMRAAQEHTESMAYKDYFAHLGPNGQTPLSRVRATGYISSRRVGFIVGENIAWGSLWLGTPHAIVAAWMRSPGHRANILDPKFRETGIGVSPHTTRLAHGHRGGLYTQDFAAIIP